MHALYSNVLVELGFFLKKKKKMLDKWKTIPVIFSESPPPPLEFPPPKKYLAEMSIKRFVIPGGFFFFEDPPLPLSQPRGEHRKIGNIQYSFRRLSIVCCCWDVGCLRLR